METSLKAVGSNLLHKPKVAKIYTNFHGRKSDCVLLRSPPAVNKSVQSVVVFDNT